jgi:hypothetical protein
MSLDAAEMDLSKAFVAGQGYVALSRVRTLSGLRLMGLNDVALKVDEEILEFDNELVRDSKKAAKELKDSKDNAKKQEEFLASVAPTQEEKEEKLSTYERTKLLLAEELTVDEIAKKREMTKGTVVGHIEKLREQGECPDITHVEKTIDKERLSKIKKAFAKSGDIKLSPVRGILGNSFTFDELRLARLFV